MARDRGEAVSTLGQRDWTDIMDRVFDTPAASEPKATRLSTVEMGGSPTPSLS